MPLDPIRILDPDLDTRTKMNQDPHHCILAFYSEVQLTQKYSPAHKILQYKARLAPFLSFSLPTFRFFFLSATGDVYGQLSLFLFKRA